MNSTHALALQAGGFNRTVCGLAVATSDTPPGLFAQAPGAATCLRCQDMLRTEAASQAARQSMPDARTLVERLVERLNANDASRMEETLDGTLLHALSAPRLGRLHQLFPGWHATVDELIADAGSVVLRYHASFSDAFGLLGATAPSIQHGQAVVLRVANHRLTDACPIVDDFAFWSAPARRADPACAHCAPRPNAEGTTRDSPHP